jgi:2-dehydropantoate 2-reductase
MKIAVMGTGGIGGYFGFRLAHSGNDVHFVARGTQLDAIRRNGLRLVTNNEDSMVQASATDNPLEIGPVDFVLFCVKTYDTTGASRSILPILKTDGIVLTLQNGVENFDQISAVVGKERVIPGAALIVSEVKEPGVIKVTTQLRRIVFGEMDGSTTSRIENIQQAFRDSGIDSEISRDMKAFLWQKMVWICGMAGMTCITRLPIGKIVERPETKQMFREVMEEVVAVARAKGVNLDPGIVDSQLALADRLEKDATSSMARDLLSGRRLELDALNGAIARFGKGLDVPAPMNLAIYRALIPYANGPP